MNLKVRPDKNYTGQNFAYVTFQTREEALAALTALKSTKFGSEEGFNMGHRIQAKLYDPRNKYRPNNIEQSLQNMNISKPQM